MPQAKNTNFLIEAQKLSSFIYRIIPNVNKKWRYGIMDSIKNTVENVLRQSYVAWGIEWGDRKPTQMLIEAELRTLDSLLLAARENRAITERQLGSLATLIMNTRRGVYRWIKGTSKDGKDKGDI
ncbi:MAG: four helix bundle protein [Christensenellaceae bacterium]|jgi:hypothetical protein|nr:four helix bundle protein [Christensenellaceae bacterium]